METLADLVSRGRDREGTALDAPGRATPYTYGAFCSSARKAGNLLRHYGVRPGSRVAVVVGPKEPDPDDSPGRLGTAADPLLAVLGGEAAGATVVLESDVPVEASALVAPADWLDRYEVAPGCSRLAYGPPPDDPDVAHFERESWSENPVEPPVAVAPDDPAVSVGDGTYAHAEVLDVASNVARDYGLDVEDAVVLDAPLDSFGVLAAGVVAPLSVGATVRLGGAGDGDDAAYVVRRDEDGTGRGLDPGSVTG